MTDRDSRDGMVYSLFVFTLLLALAFFSFKIASFFLPAICIALFIIYITRPIYSNLEKLLRNRSVSIAITLFLLIAAVGVFSFYFTTVLLSETSTLIGGDGTVAEAVSILGYDVTGMSTAFETVLEEIRTGIYNPSDVYDRFVTLGTYQSQLSYVFDVASSLLLALGGLILQLFMAFLIAFYAVKSRRSIKEGIVKITPPRHKSIVRDFISETDKGLNALFMGIFLMAVTTAMMEYVILDAYAIPYPALLALMTGVLALIPLIGPWLVYIPITALMLLVGSVEHAITFLIANFFFVSIVPDWVTKPFISAVDRKMNILIVLVGFLGGIAVFGPIGLVIGPTIMVLLASVIQVMLDKN